MRHLVLLLLATAASAGPSPVTVTVHLDAPGPRISPLIFGGSFLKEEHRMADRMPLDRWGGNRMTRLDWRTGNDAAGADWFFLNGGQNAASPDQMWMLDALRANAAARVATLVTIPTIGWVAKDNHSWSFSVAKYGPQQKQDTAHADAGNGMKPDGKTPVTGNDPADAGQPSTPADAAAFVAFLKAKLGPAGEGARRFYALDNEPALWNSTHRDVHPAPVTYDEAWRRTVEYANAIKDADPTALVFGPVEWGWLGIKYSAADNTKDAGYGPAPDSKAHQSDFFLQWYIRQLADYQKKTGRLLVDVIDVHDYPEIYVKGEGRITDSRAPEGGSPLMRRVRLEAVRTWWDPTYRAHGEGYSTWIDEPMYLLDRIQGYIRETLPELKLAVTEWDFGGRGSMNGALTHALIFQALARSGAFAACEWTAPKPDSPAAAAFRLFRNYDGKGGAFEGDYVAADSGDPLVTVFGALAPDGLTLRLAVVNADPAADRSIALRLGRSLPHRAIRVFRLTNDAPTTIREADLRPGRKSALTYLAPAYSVSLLEVVFDRP